MSEDGDADADEDDPDIPVHGFEARPSAGKDSPEIHTLRDFLAAYEDALAFLKGLGLDSRQGRLDDYRTRLRNAVLAEQKAPEASHAHQSDETFQYVLLEAREIIDIATLEVRFLQGREALMSESPQKTEKVVR